MTNKTTESQKEEIKTPAVLSDASVEKTTTKEVENSVAERPARRRKSDIQNYGPLAGIPDVIDVNGTLYRTYWAVEGDPRKPNRVYDLTTRDDYDLVTPEEVGGLETRRSGGRTGIYHVLLKKPLDYHIADTEDKARRNKENLTKTASETSSTDKNLTETHKLSMKS